MFVRSIARTIFSILLAALLVLASSCTQQNSKDTLVLATSQLNGVFSPFFATTMYDRDISNWVHAKLLTNDRQGLPADGLAFYKNPTETTDASGNIFTVYTFTLKNNLTFSDGKPITADDIIFTYKVLCDPCYDGILAVYSTPIVGVQEYRYDDPDYRIALADIAAKVAAYTPSRAEIAAMAKKLADAYGVAAENFLFGKTGYKKYCLPELKKIKQETLEKEYIQLNLLSQTARVSDIAGIKKIDSKTVQVTIEGVDSKAIWNLGSIEVVPAHYYDPNFKKGDLSKIRQKNSQPLGAGPFVFEKYENNVVSLIRNSRYYKGSPKIKKLKVQVSASVNKLDAVKLGECDISDPDASPEMAALATEAGMHYELLDNLGYGYIGINAERISDILVRKGLMCLMNREYAVKTYYGDFASIIERPMSKVSWAYPQEAKAVYNFEPARALAYFKSAGYYQVMRGGKPVLEKNGKQLHIEVGIAGEGTMDHPSAPILMQMKDELKKMGAALDIVDTDLSMLFDRLNNRQWDMWAASWFSQIDPDMYQYYHSDGPLNYYSIKNENLDRLISDARKTLRIDERKKLYSKALDIIMDQAVEMPVYQRKNMFVFNPQAINIDSIAKNMSPFYQYPMEIEKMTIKQK